MSDDRDSTLAYLATLGAIVVMTLSAAGICIFVNPDIHLAQIVAALGFISAAVTGLIGVIGTFKPKGSPAATTESGDVTVNNKGGENAQ